MVERKNNVWSEPVNVGEPINSVTAWELGCSMTRDGTLFFSSTGTDGNPDIYFQSGSTENSKHRLVSTNQINSEVSETDPAVAPDGSYLIFASPAAPT
ncbi:MAG: hypothetical protein WDO15_08535 [Bacteroidota bacterium]